MQRICFVCLILLGSSPALSASSYNPITLGFDDSPVYTSTSVSYRVKVDSYDSFDDAPTVESYEADVSELFGETLLFRRYRPHFGYRHQVGDTIGRQGGLSSFDLFFPILEDPDSNWLLFIDADLLLDDQNTNLGSNLGVGARCYLPGWNHTLGGYVYHDTRDTGSATFDQISGGFEVLGDVWESRANWYVPTGVTRKQLGETFSSNGIYQFVDHYLYTGALTWYYQAAMTGVDLETGFKFFSGFNTDFRAFGGCYYFQAQESQQTWGWKSRIESRISDMVSLNVSVQHDPLFKTTVNFAAGIQWPSLSGLRDKLVSGLTARDRLGETPHRLRSIVVDNQEVEDPNGLYLINPSTGRPYYFMHVATGGNSDGSYEDPYATLAATFADPRTQAGDLIVYDHRNSSETGNYLLGPDTRVLSTGPAQYIDTQFGQLQLPDSNSGLTPQITGNFTMHNNTELNGFSLTNGSAASITANGVGNILIARNTIASSFNGSAVSLTGLTGPVTFNQSPLTAANGTGVSVLNSNADITFVNSPIINTNGNGADIQNSSGTIQLGSITTTNGTTSVNIASSTANITIDELDSTDAGTSALIVNQLTGSLNLQQGSFSNSGVAGAQILNSDQITLRNLTIDTPVSNATGASLIADGSSNLLVSNSTINHQGAGTAINLANSTGPTTFDQSPIAKSDGLAVSISGGSGDIAFTNNSAITNTNGEGIDIQNAGGTIQFGLITTTNGAISANVNNSSADITIAGLSSTDATTSAIAINSLTGSFTLNSGTISNSGVAGLQATNSQDITISNTTFTTPVTNNTGASITADSVSNLLVSNSPITHLGTATAINLTNSTGAITFNQSPLSKSGGLGVSISGGSGDITFTNSAITNTNGEGIDIQNAGGTIQFGQITTTNGAISANVNNSSADITIADLDSDNTSNSPVVINDLTGSFTLNGGTFTNIGTAGAQITSSSNVSILGVTMETPATHGIFAQNVDHFNFSGNTINNAAQDGIRVLNGSGSSSISGNTIRSILNAFDNAILVTTTGNTNLDIDNNTISSLLTIGSNGIDITTNSGDATINVRMNEITSIANGFGDAIRYVGNSSGEMNTTISDNTIENTAGLFGDAIHVRYNAGSATTTIAENTIDSDDLINLMDGGIYLNLDTTGATETFIDQNVISNDAVAGLLNDGILVDIDQGTNNTIVHITENELGRTSDILDDGIQVLLNNGTGNVAHVQVNDNQIYGLLNFGLNVGVSASNDISMQVTGNDTSVLTTLNFLSGLGTTTKIEDITNLSANNSNAIVLLLGLGTYQNTTDWLLP